MKRIFFKPITVIAATAFGLFSCASSQQDTYSTAMDSIRMSETAAMGGLAPEENQLDVLVIEERVMVPVATTSVTTLIMENPEKVADMFKDIEDTEEYDVLALARTSPNLSTFVHLVEQANLEDDLHRVKAATLLAPTNAAFAKLSKEQLTTLLAHDNTALLANLLQMHIVASDVSSAQLRNNSRIRISETNYLPIEFGTAGTNLRIAGAQVVRSDIEAANGRIHVLDTVILPGK